MFAEKLISPCRKGATGAKVPKDRRSALLENHEKWLENPEEDEGKNCELCQDEGRKESPLGTSLLVAVRGQPYVPLHMALERVLWKYHPWHPWPILQAWLEESQWTFDFCCPHEQNQSFLFEYCTLFLSLCLWARQVNCPPDFTLSDFFVLMASM